MLCTDGKVDFPVWKLWCRQTYSDPILAIDGWETRRIHRTEDNHNDFLSGSILVVTTTKAIHILKYDDQNCKLTGELIK